VSPGYERILDLTLPMPGHRRAAERDAALLNAWRDQALAAQAAVASVRAWRDELALSRGGWDADIAAKLTELLAPAEGKA